MPPRKNNHQLCSVHLMKVVPVLMRVFRRSIVQADPVMSPAQLKILDYLRRCPGASLSQLSGELEIRNATASSHVDRLVRRGLVERKEDPRERRRVILTITATGLNTLNKVNEMCARTFAEMLSTLPSEKLKRITDGLVLLEDAAKQYAESSACHTEVS